MSARKITFISVLAFLWLIAVFAFKGKSKQVYEQAKLSVDMLQLPAEGGIIPVEIQRAKIHLPQPNEIEDFSCVVKNNTTKAITALALEWTFTADNNGKPSSLSENSEMDAIYHPDIQDYRKLRALAPGNEMTMESSSGTTVAPPARIVKAEVTLKYVEFGDKSLIDLDPRHSSSKRINEEREGAERYKQWLAQIYKQQGKGLKNVIPLLRGESFPTELNLNTHPLHHGAKMYGKFMLSLYTNNQQEAMEKYLSQ